MKLDRERDYMLRKIGKSLISAGFGHLSLAYREKRIKSAQYLRITVGNYPTVQEAKVALETINPHLPNPGRVTYLTREERQELTFKWSTISPSKPY